MILPRELDMCAGFWILPWDVVVLSVISYWSDWRCQRMHIRVLSISPHFIHCLTCSWQCLSIKCVSMVAWQEQENSHDHFDALTGVSIMQSKSLLCIYKYIHVQAFQLHNVKREMERERERSWHPCGWMFFTSTHWKNDRWQDTKPENQDRIVGMLDEYSLQAILWHLGIINFVFHRRYHPELGDEEKENISGSKPAKLFLLLSCLYPRDKYKYRHSGTKTSICCEVIRIYLTEFTYQYSFQTVSSYHQLYAQSCWLHINKQIAGSDLLCQLQSENIKNNVDQFHSIHYHQICGVPPLLYILAFE